MVTDDAQVQVGHQVSITPWGKGDLWLTPQTQCSVGEIDGVLGKEET